MQPAPRLLTCLLTLATCLLAACATSPYPPAEAPVAVVPPPALRSGDTWVYAQVNGYNGLVERTVTDRLVASGPGFIIERRSDRLGEPVQTETIAAPWREVAETTAEQRRVFSSPLARFPFPIAAARGWQEQATVPDAYGVNFLWRPSGRAVGWERVRTPAGEFVALRIE